MRVRSTLGPVASSRWPGIAVVDRFPVLDLLGQRGLDKGQVDVSLMAESLQESGGFCSASLRTSCDTPCAAALSTITSLSTQRYPSFYARHSANSLPPLNVPREMVITHIDTLLLLCPTRRSSIALSRADLRTAAALITRYAAPRRRRGLTGQCRRARVPTRAAQYACALQAPAPQSAARHPAPAPAVRLHCRYCLGTLRRLRLRHRSAIFSGTCLLVPPISTARASIPNPAMTARITARTP